jgi:hypothetical protein
MGAGMGTGMGAGMGMSLGGMGPGNVAQIVTRENVPLDEVEVRRGEHVHASRSTSSTRTGRPVRMRGQYLSGWLMPLRVDFSLPTIGLNRRPTL